MIFDLTKFRDFSIIISPITKSNTYYLSIVHVQNDVSLRTITRQQLTINGNRNLLLEIIMNKLLLNSSRLEKKERRFQL